MKKIYIILIMSCLMSVSLSAQTATERYQQQELHQGRLSAERWKSSVQAIDYTPQPRRPPEVRAPRTPRTTWNPRVPRVSAPSVSFSFADNFWKILLVVIGVAVLAGIVFKLVLGRNTSAEVRRPEDFVLEDIEKNLHEAEIDRFLREALGKQDYRLAVRLYFLAVMKELSIKKIIDWQRDKTNGAYLREVRYNASQWSADFARITLIFEYVWYSERQFDAQAYAEVEPYYKNMLQKVS